MWKLSPILLICSLVGIHAHFNVRWREVQENNMPHPVKLNDCIVLVGWLDKKNFYVKSEPANCQTPVSCKIPVSIEETRIVNPIIVASALGNGKIVASGIKTAPSGKDPSNFFIIVNPVDCTIKTIDIPGENDKVLYEWIPVVYEDTFDLFPSSRNGAAKTSAVRRYNDKGEQIKFDDTLDSMLELKDARIYVSAINEKKDPSGGYLIAVNKKEGMTLNLLSPTLKIKKQIVKKDMSTCSISTGFNNITVCYLNKMKELFCENLDKELNSRFKVKMAEVPNGFVNDAWATNLPDGGAMIVQQSRYVNLESGKRVDAVQVQNIDNKGATSKALVIRKDREVEHILPKGFLMSNNEFCIGVVEVNASTPGETYNGLYATSDVIVYCFKR